MRYFLLDANVLVSYYCPGDNDRVRGRVAPLFAARAAGKVFLYVPNFCVAEVLRAFAKKCWGDKLYADPDEAFSKFRTAFLEDVVASKQLYSYELSRRHVKMTDQILEASASMSYRAGSAPSAFDVLLIAMGFDLANIHGHSQLLIVTAERPIYDVCRGNKAFPKAINLIEQELPREMLS